MLKIILGARPLAPVLAAALLGGLAACGPSDTSARLTTRQAAVDPPRLWRAEVLGPRGRVEAAVLVCVDRRLMEGLARAGAEVNDEPCRIAGAVVEHPGLYALRCEVAGRRFGMTLNRRGDLTRDFTVDFALTPLDAPGPAARQLRRYREVGPCPAGWGIGDQARPGRGAGANAVGG